LQFLRVANTPGPEGVKGERVTEPVRTEQQKNGHLEKTWYL
jgi:hypothetical protein